MVILRTAANALNTNGDRQPQIATTAENTTERNGRKMLVLDGCATDEKSKSSGGTSTGSGDASDADWTKEGTKAYEMTKKVFMAFVNHGTTGEFAAGVVGWVNSEGSSISLVVRKGTTVVVKRTLLKMVLFQQQVVHQIHLVVVVSSN